MRQNRQVWEFTYDPGTLSFVLFQTVVLPGEIGSDIEACAQVDRFAVDELYTLSEDDGRIARVIDIDGAPTVDRVWNLEVMNNGHSLPPETSNRGPEGLEFVPDADLLAAGFRFPDGGVFTGSTKGMGGLVFVGHQIDGRLHVFDLNPDVSEDFVNHGSFLTSESEIAGLHFDRSSGNMYLWHSPSGVKTVAVSTLSSNGSLGTIDTFEVYDSAMPSGNVEGLALVGRTGCGEMGALDSERLVFLARDGSSPNLGYFDDFPCDCTGAENEEEFDVCAARGDLGGGCVCLDQDLDGDVDCDDFHPPISSQCAAPVPLPGGWALASVVLAILLAAAVPLLGRREFWQDR
jgi:hypothetical protein